MNRLDNNTFNLEGLEKLPSGELSKMLREELDRSHKDEALILRILHILEQRHTVPSFSPESVAAWIKFREASSVPEQEIPAGRKRGYAWKRWLGGAVAAALVACLLFAFTPRVEGKPNLFEAIGQWTQDLFSFFSSGYQEDDYTFTTDDSGLQQIYDAVVEQGTNAAVVPTWIPEGYELTELKVHETPGGNKVHARLVSGDNYIVISYKFYAEEAANKYAKDDADMEEYEIGGVKYYLMPNEEMWTAAWTVEKMECSIGTNLSEEVLRQILISIYQEVI